MKSYSGFRVVDAAVVYVHSEGGFKSGEILSIEPSRRVVNHSPCGFEFGFNGSGPAQLALAILLDFTGSPQVAETNYQEFKSQVVSHFGDKWTLTGAEIERWLKTGAHPEV